MTKLYHGPEGFGWQVPGQQERKAVRVDVPNPPAELADWLNDRWVPRDKAEPTIAEVLALEQQRNAGDDGRPWEAGPATKDPPRYAPEHHGELGKVDFVPITRAAAIAASFNACPSCSKTWLAQVLDGIDRTQDLDVLQRIAERIKERVAGVADELEQAGRAN